MTKPFPPEQESKPFACTDRDLTTLLERIHLDNGTEVFKATVRNRKRAIQVVHHVVVIRLGKPDRPSPPEDLLST